MQNPVRAFGRRPRLLASIALTVGLAAFLPVAPVWTRLLIGWCVGVIVYTVLVTWRAAGQSRDAMRREASDLDDSASMISVFSLAAAAASVGAVVMLVIGQSAPGASRVADIALAAATMVCTWVFVQIVFTVHYAHLYYGDAGSGESRGGLDFNGDMEPDFFDFVYFSFTIGATSQTSDTAITAKAMRRIATVQTVYAYFFNTRVLALAINMAAGLASH